MGNGPELFGRDWISEITLDDGDGIGKVKGIMTTLSLKDNASPKFVKA